jgi:HlyD family secretion protein
MWKPKAIAGLIIIVAVLIGVLGWRLSGPRSRAVAAEGAGATSLAVSTTVVTRQATSDSAQSTGVVAAAQRAELSAKVMGRVAEVYVREGELVHAGQVLARLEAADLAASVAQASANARAAGATLTQAQTGAELQKEQSRARVEQASEALKSAQARLSAVQEGSRQQERASADQSVVQAEAEARTAESNYHRFQKLYDSGAISAMEADSRRLEYEVAKSRLETARQQASLTHEGSRRQDVQAAQAQVAAAKDALRLAKASLAENRMKADQARVAQAQLGQAQAAEEAARVQYGYSQLVAPFAGVVVSRLADPGDLASPGTVLLVVEDNSVYRLEAQVPEETVRRLHLGQTVRVAIDALDRPLTGRVTRLLPSADPSSHTVVVKVDLPATPGLGSGLFGRLQLSEGGRETIQVPARAVLQRGQLSQVYVVEDGRAAMRLVTLGERRGDLVEVLSGLEAGEHIVSVATESLHDGQAVREAGR